MPKNSAIWNDESLRAIAHDLKNELASILALAEMIEVLVPPESQSTVAPHVQKIRERVKRSSEKITDTFQQLREAQE